MSAPKKKKSKKTSLSSPSPSPFEETTVDDPLFKQIEPTLLAWAQYDTELSVFDSSTAAKRTMPIEAYRELQVRRAQADREYRRFLDSHDMGEDGGGGCADIG